MTLLLTHSGLTVRSHRTQTSILHRPIFNHELTSFLCKYLAEQTCSSGINNHTIQFLSMPTVESRLICIKTSSIRMSGAPVWHSLPVYPELQLHEKLPTVFMHDPPFWQRVFPDVDPHSSMSKAHITLKFCCLTATVFFLLDRNCFIAWLLLLKVRLYS